jgi:hypothetical protein
MEKNDDYFDSKSESEKMRNVANIVHEIVNVKSTEEDDEEKSEVQVETAETEEPEVNPVVELVGKAISNHKPRGLFMQGVQTDDNPKL